jgi:hypothetical protein
MVFVRFIEGLQVESIQRNTSPGEDWIAAPPDFDWNKRYKLVEGEFVEMTAEEIEEASHLNDPENPENPGNPEHVEVTEQEGGVNA